MAAITRVGSFGRALAVVGMVFVLLAGIVFPKTTYAYEGRFLAHEDIILYGMGLKVEPAKQVVPKNIATIVSAYLQVPTLPAGEISPLAPDALVKGTLRGPGLETPLELTARANTPFNIPPLTVPGMYSLDNIRLESGGEILFRGTPESVSIEIIEKLLVSQITARPLTAQEIKDKGIVFDKTNFQAYNFTAAFAIGSGDPIKIDMPVILPNLASATDVNVDTAVIGSLPEPQLKDVRTIIPDALRLAQTKIPNLSVKTFSLKALDYKGNTFDLPPIPGVIVIPGDIGFLNQYFSVMLMVGNVAPEYSNLVVKDITATILLPAGNDKVVGSSDDPLAMANTTKGPSPMLQAVVQPGLDGKLGTADDIVSLAPGQSGNAEFLVEGRREGSHTIEMEITGTLTGLPIGPVTVRGRAIGTVLVRNPNFTLTFTHPDVVNAGEEYVLDVTVTNTSESPANFVSVNLHQQQISGADLVGEGSQQIETIPPGDSATVCFNLRSKVTGTIFAATLDSDEHVSGRFQLKTSVGELGIPLSPDSLVLPKEAGSLPKALRDAAIGLLGKAYAVATAPAAALPKDVIRFGKKIVWDRGIEVAQAGFRYTLHEPLPDSAEQLLFDFMGSNYTRLAETNPLPADRSNAESDYSGFDDLRRRSIRGDVLADAVANLLKPDLAAKGGSDFQRDLASKIAYRPEHLSVMLDSGNSPLPVTLTLVDSQGRKLGGAGAKGKIVKEIPYGDYLTFKDQTTTPQAISSQLAIIAVPTAGAFRIRLERLPGADPAATFNLAIVAPDAAGVLQQRSFSALTTATLPTVDLAGSPYSFTVETYAEGLPLTGTPQVATISRPIPDIAPSIISVVQQPDADMIKNDCGLWRFGRIVAVLFSEEVTAASVQDKLGRSLITNYTLAGNQVVGVALQPGNRIAFLALRDPIGQFIPRSITFDSISDRRGTLLASQSVPIEATIEDPGAVVSGKVLKPDGTLLSGAEVRLFTQIQMGLECENTWYGISSKSTGADAAFGWDFVLKQTNKIVAVNPEDEEFRSVPFSVARNGQRLNVNIVFLGRGTLTGRILGEDAMTPLSNAQIRVTSLTDNSQFAYTTDSTGKYTIPKIPVGNLIIEVVHLGTNSKITQSSYIGASGSTVELNLVLLTEAVRKITAKYGTISGHVLHYDGATPVSGVPVYGFYQDNSQDGVRCPLVPGPDGPFRPIECAVASGTTTAAGAYSFVEIPAGNHRLYTFDQAASQEGTARITLAVDGTASANILLNGGFGTIKGIVKDADGTPVAGAEVGGGLSLTKTDVNGLFTLIDVPVGSRTIVAVSQALLAQGQVTVDVSTPGAEYGATIVLQSQGGIYGAIHTADGALASGIKVNLLQNDGLVAVAITNASGAYQFANVPVGGGEYIVSAFLPDLSDGNIGSTAIRFQGQRVRLDLTFKGKGTVTGSISNAQGTTGLVGKVSVSALRVVAAQSGQDLVGLRFEYTQHLQIADTTFASNRFSFSNVFVGPIVITAAGVFSPDPVIFPGEIKANGDTENFDMRLTATSVITGTVYGPDGVSVSKNALITYKSDEFKTICTEDACTTMPQGIQNETAVSDEFGKFTLPLVNAGKFTLSVVEQDSVGNPLGHIGRLSGLVRAGQTADVSVRLQARAPVRVTVYTHNSTTLVANAWVTIEEAARIGNTARKYKTDQNGVVLFSGLDALNEGSFTALAESNDGFVGRASGKIVADGTEVAVNVYLFDHTVTVKGVVYRPDGITPVANAEVSISNASGDLAFAVTNASGEYIQDFIPLGDFRLEVFEAATGRRGFATATAYISTPTVTVNINEMAIGQVQGTLFQSGALTPLSRWEVILRQTFPSGRSMSLVATTGLDGRFTFPGVPVGEFSITASYKAELPVSVRGYLTREGEVVDIPLVATLAKPSRGTISGWVYHPDGTPAADAAVCIINPYYGQCTSLTTADGDGHFIFTDVALGRFVIQAGSQVTHESGLGYGDLPYAGATGYVKVVMAGLGTISGTVVDGGVIAKGAKIVLIKSPDAGCGTVRCTNYADATTGKFTFVNVPAGTFTVYAEDPANPQKNGSTGGLLTPGGSALVTVPFADTGSLKVKVIFANGTPASGIVAELRRLDGFALYHDTDGTGLVTFNGVPKGDYLLTLQDPAGLGIAKKTVQIVNDLDLSNAPLMLDEAPPAVKSSSPLPGEIRVALAAPIVITFSEPVQPGSIDAASFSLTTATGPVTGSRVMSVNDTVVTFTPLQPLKDESRYTIRVSGVKDRVDRPMLQDFVANFTTVDITPPHIVSFGPTRGSSGAPLESVIRIMFSEPVNPAAFTGTAITVNDSTGPLAGRVDMVFGNTGMVFTPLYPLKENTAYTVTLLPARDLSDNLQATEPPYTFRSLDRTPPVISSLTAPATVIENAVATLTPVFAGGSDITVVDWYLNGAPAGAVRPAQSATYSFSFQALPSLGIPGGTPIKVTAIATDTSGNRALIGTETSITVITDTPPTATITLPLGGASVRNTERVVVRVEALDDMGVTRIAYQAVGGQFPAADTVAVSPTAQTSQKEFAFYVPADAVPGAQIVINATVVDSKGQSGKAAPVTITVSDATPPVVAFAGLSSGAVVTPGQKITAVVTASDLGGIKQVSFRANSGTLELRDISPPQNSVAASFSYTVPNSFTSADIVRLEAFATDVAGNNTAAAAVVLPVADTTPPQVTLRTSGNTDFMVPGQSVTIIVDAQDASYVTGITLTGSGAFTYSNTQGVTPPVGITQKSFSILIPGTVAEGSVMTLSATAVDAVGNVSSPVTLNLTARVLAGVQLPASQLIAAGDTVQLAITLYQPAPAAGVQVDLTPATAAIQLQPASLSFAAGETTKNFTLNGMSGGNSSVGVAIQSVTLGRVIVTVRGGVVSGTVINAAKAPVAGAEVVVNGTSIVAAADGTFLVEGIAGPAVSVKAYDTANNMQGAVSGVMNAANGFLRGLTVTVSAAGSITGTVKQADLTPVGAGVQVDLMDPQNSSIALSTTFTAADGSYSFAKVPLGSYTVEARDTNANRGRSSAYLTVSGAQVVVPVTFLGKGTITGIVQDGSNAGISGLTVTMQSTSIFGSLSTTAITGTSGSFSFTEVPVGSFSLSTKDDLTNMAASTTGSIAVHAQTVTANLKLASWASLEGIVYRYDGSTPAAGVTVTASGHSTITDNLGAYRFEVLPLTYHTVTAEDKAARAKASVPVSLQIDKENRVQNISLSGSGSMAVTVIDSSLTPVVGATVTLIDGFGQLTASSDAVGAVVFDRVYPGGYDVSALSGKMHGTVRGTLALNEAAAVFVTIAADPSATISGTVFAPDGQTPAGGVSVMALRQYSYTGPSMTTAGDGTYQFTTLAPGDYSVTVSANGQLRAKATGIKLVSDGQIVTRDLTMIGLGTVNGRVLEPASSVGSPNIPVTVRSLHPDFGRAYSVRTNAAGFYQVDQVPVGSISVSAGDISLQKLGDASGILTADGTTLTLDVVLQNNAVTLPQSLTDGNGFSSSIQGTGAFTGSAFGDSGAALLHVTPVGGTAVPFAAVTAATQEQLGREIALRQADVAGLTVTRKVYVPQDGYFTRYLEIFDNLTGVDKAVTVGVKSSFSSGYLDYYYRFSIDSTSSGDKLLQTSGQNPDFWSVFDNYYTYGGSGVLKSAMVWGGPGAATPASQAVTTPSTSAANAVLGLTNAWDLTVPANGRVAILYFVVQHKDLTGAKAAAERLVQLPPEALTGLSQDELLAIRNFAVPIDGSSPLTAMPPLTGNVTVNLQDTFGAALTGVTTPSAVPVTLQSTNPIFNRIFTGNADSTTGQVIFKSSNNTYAFQDVPLLLGPYTVTAKRKFNPSCSYYGYCTERPSVDVSASGDFTPGSTQAVNTLTFTNSGNISGFIRKSTGEAVVNTPVELYYSGTILTTSTASDGSYSFKVITPGQFFVTISVPTGGSNDTAINTGQAVTVIAGQLHTIDLTLPPLGTITGQLQAWNGTPLSSTRIDLRGTTNGVVRIKTTDTGGNAAFGMVPPGTYTLSASDPVSGVGKYSSEVVMVGGENLTQTLQFGKSGRVAATVFFADGTAVANGNNLKLEIFDAVGALLTSNTYFYSNPFYTPFFASNEAEFKVRLTYSYNQPSSYYTTFTSVSDSTISGFTGVSTTALPVSVTLPVNRGNVTVQLTNISGANYSGSAVPIELRDPVSDAVWGSCSSNPTTGNCTVNNLVVGSGGFAVKVVMNGLVVAETTATMATSGQIQTVVLQLPYDPVAFPKTLYDANAFSYEIRGDGALQNGKNYVFSSRNYGDPGALAMTLIDPASQQAAVMFTGASTGVAEDLGRELSSSQTGLLGLTVKRKVYVPIDGYFARYLDIFTNPGTTPVTVNLELGTYFYDNSSAVLAASDGSSDLQSTIRDLSAATWAVVKDSIAQDPFMNTSSKPAVALVWRGNSASLTPATVKFDTQYNYKNLKTGYQPVTVPAGQSVALMSFLVQQTSTAAAQASAERLVQLPPEALSGLSSQEQAMIANFTMPADGTSTLAPLPPLTGTAIGDLKPYDGLASSLPVSRTAYLKSDSPYFGRSYNMSYNNNNSVFTFTGNPNGSADAVVVPLTGFTMYGDVFHAAYGIQSPAVTGVFAAGQTSASVDVLFTTSGRITVSALKADGTPITTATVKATTDAACQYNYYCKFTPNFIHNGAGSYLLDFAKAVPHYLTAVIPPPAAPNSGGTSLTLTATVTPVDSTTTPVEMRLQLLGAIKGSVNDLSGNPAYGNFVRVTSTTDANFSRWLNTYSGYDGGPGGTFVFADLPADTYLLEVRDSYYNNSYLYKVTIAAGEISTGVYNYQNRGTVSGTVAWVDAVPVKSRSFQVEVINQTTGIVLYSGNMNVNNGFYSFPLATGPGPLTIRCRLNYSNNGVVHDTWFTKEIPAGLAANGDILTADYTLPVYYNNLLVKVEDSNHAPLLYSIPVSVLAADGTKLNDQTNISDTTTIYGLYPENPALTVRAVFNNMNFDVPVSLSPSDAVTAPSVTITIPTVTATLQGTVVAGDGITPLPSYFNYTITRGNGDAVLCGQRWYYNTYYYQYMLTDVYTNCTTYDGTFGIKDINGALLTHPFLPGETLKLTVQGGDLYALGTLSTTFTFPTATTAANITAAMPVFVAKGTVTYTDVSPATAVGVSMLQASTGGGTSVYSATTDSAGAFTLFGATTGTYSLTAQTNNGVSGALATCGSAVPDPCTISGFDKAITGLDITLEPSGTVSGTLKQGGNAVAGMTVSITYTDRVLTLTTITDPTGGFSFSQVPYGAFTVKSEVLDRSGGVVSSSNVATGTLDAQHATVGPVDLVMTQLPGTISGFINAPDGLLTDYCNYYVDLTRVSDGTTYWTRTDCGGRYGFANLPADNYLISYADYTGGEGPYYSGYASGWLVAGGMLAIDFAIHPAQRMSYYSSISVQGAGDPFIYDVSQGGKLQYGGSTDSTLSGPFSYQNMFNGSSSSYSGWFVPDGQFVVQPWVAGGVLYSRKLYLPTGGSYLRYLETIENSGTAPLGIAPSLTGTMSYLNSGIWDYLDAPASNAGALAVVQTVGTTGYPLVGMVVGGNGSPAATVNATLTTAAAANWTWNNLTVPAGGKTCLLHYIFQAVPTDTAAATAKAEALRNLTEPGALDLLTAEERACIANFVVPAP